MSLTSFLAGRLRLLGCATPDSSYVRNDITRRPQFAGPAQPLYEWPKETEDLGDAAIEGGYETERNLLAMCTATRGCVGFQRS